MNRRLIAISIVALAVLAPLSRVGAQTTPNSTVRGTCGSSEQSNITLSAQLIQVIYNMLTTGEFPPTMFPSFENLIVSVQKVIDAYLLACAPSTEAASTATANPSGSPVATTTAQDVLSDCPSNETIGIYSNETYTDKNCQLRIKATNFPSYAFNGTVTVLTDGESDPISMTLGQRVPIVGFEITLQSIAPDNTGYVNGETVTSDYATLTIAKQTDAQ